MASSVSSTTRPFPATEAGQGSLPQEIQENSASASASVSSSAPATPDANNTDYRVLKVFIATIVVIASYYFFGKLGALLASPLYYPAFSRRVSSQPNPQPVINPPVSQSRFAHVWSLPTRVWRSVFNTHSSNAPVGTGEQTSLGRPVAAATSRTASDAQSAAVMPPVLPASIPVALTSISSMSQLESATVATISHQAHQNAPVGSREETPVLHMAAAAAERTSNNDVASSVPPAPQVPLNIAPAVMHSSQASASSARPAAHAPVGSRVETSALHPAASSLARNNAAASSQVMPELVAPAAIGMARTPQPRRRVSHLPTQTPPAGSSQFALNSLRPVAAAATTAVSSSAMASTTTMPHRRDDSVSSWNISSSAASLSSIAPPRQPTVTRPASLVARRTAAAAATNPASLNAANGAHASVGNGTRR